MKLKLSRVNIKITSKSVQYFKDHDTFYIPKKFIEEKGKNLFANFPQWYCQIYVRHNDELFTIFMEDFENYVLNNVPIPFHLHFGKKVTKQPKKPSQAELRTRITFKDQELSQPTFNTNLEPTHDEWVMAKRNGEIE